METIKLKILISGIRYKTFGNGKVGAVITVSPMCPKSEKIIEKYGFTQILVDSVNELLENHIGLGSVHVIGLNPETSAVEFKMREYPIIEADLSDLTKCQTCGAILEQRNDDMFCGNLLCAANSLSSVIKIMSNCSNVFSLSEIKYYLDNYISDGDVVGIRNLFEFYQNFFSVKEKNTASRETLWKTLVGGDNGEKCFYIDVAYQNELVRDSYKYSEFWSACNFPEVPYGSHPDWDKLSPSYVLGLESICTDIEKKISPDVVKTISDNIDFIALMYDCFTNGRDVRWIPT